MGRVKKKTPEEIDRSLLFEPPMTAEDLRDYREGWHLFNQGHFWHAHEAWEAVWRRHVEESRIFFQGIIQFTAACDLIVVKQRYGGALANLKKSEMRLQLFPSDFLGLDIPSLIESVRSVRKEMERVGPDHLTGFDRRVLPRIQPREELKSI